MWPSEKQCGLLGSFSRSEHNYNSNDGMQSAVSGPPMWMGIHLIAFNYPVAPSEADKQHYKEWLWSVGHVLPCRYCRENFAKNMASANFNDDVMQSRATFSRFCYDLHDNVNCMLGKTSPPYEDIREMYELMRARCMTDSEKQASARSSKELGCIRPSHTGSRGKCVLQIVPYDTDCQGLSVDRACQPGPG